MNNNELTFETILLVEDDKIDIGNIQRIFEKFEFNCPLTIAKNGIDALNKLQGRGGEKQLDPMPRVILLDINMPKMNGIDFVKELRKDPRLNSILVFILTTSNNERDVVALYDLNIAGYFVKGVEFNESMKTIQTLIQYWSYLRIPSAVGQHH